MRQHYVPRQRDIVWIDFDPTRGREIQKRRPALVISSDAYNASTEFVVVMPVTSTLRNSPTRHTLATTKTTISNVVITYRDKD